MIIECLIGIGIGEAITESYWKKQIIKHNYAEYDSITGNWQWKK